MTAPARGRGRAPVLVALAIAGTAFLAVTLGGIGKSLVYYWGPTEVRKAGDKAVGATIRLGGLVASGSILRGEGSSLEFRDCSMSSPSPVRAPRGGPGTVLSQKGA